MVSKHQGKNRDSGAKRGGGIPKPEAERAIEFSEQASEVDHDRFPNWFRLRLLRAFGPSSWGSTASWLLFENWVRTFCWPSLWIDHEGTAIVNGEEAFVSEPYLTLDYDFSCVQELAEKIGCDLVISEQSHHLPGRTIRLAFVPKPST